MRTLANILVLNAILLAVPCFAFQNEPNGFRGITWGEDVSKRTDMAPLSAGADKTVSYTRKGDVSLIGDVKLSLLAYDYWDGKFSGVAMVFRDADQFLKLKDICFERYGEGKKLTSFPEAYVWEGRKAVVMLKFNPIPNDGFLSIKSMRFFKEKQSYDKKKAKEAAEKGF